MFANFMVAMLCKCFGYNVKILCCTISMLAKTLADVLEKIFNMLCLHNITFATVLAEGGHGQS